MVGINSDIISNLSPLPGCTGQCSGFQIYFWGTELVFFSFQTHSYPEFQICQQDASWAPLVKDSAVCEGNIRCPDHLALPQLHPHPLPLRWLLWLLGGIREARCRNFRNPGLGSAVFSLFRLEQVSFLKHKNNELDLQRAFIEIIKLQNVSSI